MRKVNQFTIIPDQMEILDHAAVFGMKAGEVGTVKRHFGVRDGLENPVAICIDVGVFDHSEQMLEYWPGMSMQAAVISGPKVMIMSTKPYAEVGDPENVWEKHYGMQLDGTTVSNQPVKSFVNDKDEFPGEQQFKYVFGKREDGTLGMIKKPVDDNGFWLQPFVHYYLTYRRLGSAVFGDVRNTPLSMRYSGGGDAALETQFNAPANPGTAPPVGTIDLTDVVGEQEVYPATLPYLGEGLFFPTSG